MSDRIKIDTGGPFTLDELRKEETLLEDRMFMESLPGVTALYALRIVRELIDAHEAIAALRPEHFGQTEPKRTMEEVVAILSPLLEEAESLRDWDTIRPLGRCIEKLRGAISRM